MIRRLVFVSVLSVLSAGCFEKEENKQPVANQTLTVSAVQTKTKDVDLAFEYTGKAQGSKETEVRARVGGILLKRNYTEGSNVQAGQVLFEIDPEPYKIALDKAVRGNFARGNSVSDRSVCVKLTFGYFCDPICICTGIACYGQLHHMGEGTGFGPLGKGNGIKPWNIERCFGLHKNSIQREQMRHTSPASFAATDLSSPVLKYFLIYSS